MYLKRLVREHAAQRAHSSRHSGAVEARPRAGASTCCRWQATRQHRQHQHLQRSSSSTCGRDTYTGHFRSAALSGTRGSSSSSSSGSGSGPDLSSSPVEVLALDVEYVHLALPQQLRLGRSRISILPAEVCLAAPGGVIAFHSFCRPGVKAMVGACHVGGVSEALWRHAPPIAEVVAQVQAHIKGRRVVGHGLGKDLAALGVEHPRELQVDTVACRAFQGPSGQARPLSVLTELLLGRSIQASAVHSAREDALATLELYLGFVAADTAQMDAPRLQQHELEQILAHARASGSQHTN